MQNRADFHVQNTGQLDRRCADGCSVCKRNYAPECAEEPPGRPDEEEAARENMACVCVCAKASGPKRPNGNDDSCVSQLSDNCSLQRILAQHRRDGICH